MSKKKKSKAVEKQEVAKSGEAAFQVSVEAIRDTVVQARMFESSQPPKRLETFFADATDAYADQITQESVRQEMRANSRKVYLTEGCTNHGTFTMGVHCVGTHGPELAMIPPRNKRVGKILTTKLQS